MVHFSFPLRVEEAVPKINLSLRVGSRRADGFHEVASLVVTALGVGDRVIAEEREVDVPRGRKKRKKREEAQSTNTLTLVGPFAGALAGEDLLQNSVVRARALFLEEHADLISTEAHTLASRLHLLVVKNLPVGAGFGGGSSDAAACLRILRDFLQVEGLSGLSGLASRLGADVAACLRTGAFWVTGAGEEVRPFPRLPRAFVLLAWPGRGVSTSEVYAAFSSGSGAMDGGVGETATFAAPPQGGFSDISQLCEWCRGEGNDLTYTASRLAPEIDALLQRMSALPGARMAAMSGSGSGCFALFDSMGEAERARSRLRDVWASIAYLP
ncbi:MAG: 4-(cytidine 5'-diphospho)-2-C-methyl-D-erythritol kinase [Alphaproteobacteria bacterium]